MQSCAHDMGEAAGGLTCFCRQTQMLHQAFIHHRLCLACLISLRKLRGAGTLTSSSIAVN